MVFLTFTTKHVNFFQYSLFYNSNEVAINDERRYTHIIVIIKAQRYC